VPRTTLIAWAVLLLGALAIFLAFWPGRISIDSLGEITEAATAHFSNRGAPLLLALWSPFWDLGFGPGAVLLASVVTFLIGAYLVLRAAFRPLGAAVVAVAIALSPPVFGNLGAMQRDTWFIALLVLAFGLVVRAAQRPWPVRGRYLALALLAALLTPPTRQNAPAAAALACVAISGLLLGWPRKALPPCSAPRRPSR